MLKFILWNISNDTTGSTFYQDGQPQTYYILLSLPRKDKLKLTKLGSLS